MKTVNIENRKNSNWMEKIRSVDVFIEIYPFKTFKLTPRLSGLDNEKTCRRFKNRVPLKIDLKAEWTHESMPTAWELM